jgi:hypothetical protein
MKKIKFSHILFSLALIAALTLAAVPAAPVYALSASAAASTVITANQANSPALVSNNILVCRIVIEWRHGHRIAVRRCHKVVKPAA